jgi:hypothetical protein
MRMLLPAAAAAVLVLAAVVFVGLRVLDDEEPAWAEQASAVCEGGLSDTRALIASAASVTDPERRFLQVYAGSTEVEAGVLATLQGLPRPAEEGVAIAETLRVVGDSHRADRAALRRLRREFDVELLQRRIDEAAGVLALARGRFASLGAEACVDYYDPASYE